MTAFLRGIAGAALLVALAGCGKSGSGAENLPGPGELKVVSVEEISSGERGSLLNNGDFDTWFAGAPYPEAIQVPDPAQSEITRTPQYLKNLKSRFQMNQIWKASDEAAPPEKLLGVFADGLSAGATYRLHVVASSIEGTTARLSVYEIVKDKYELLAKDVIEIKLEQFKEYNGTFTAKNGGRVVVVSNSANLAGKQRVVWHLWSLTPA